jgi:alpha-D-ribose 1-methylphosphonate 5-triphosphate synthase subunit PhnG
MSLSPKHDKQPGMQEPQSLSLRKERLALLARARHEELAEPLGAFWPDEKITDLRKAEVGLVMLRGRMGGDGAMFNLGEATMTRAAVELASGQRGFGQCLGRKPQAARMIAVLDAIGEREPEALEAKVLAPVRARLAAEHAEQAAQTAATRVEFFTLVRGDPDT